MFFFHFGTWNHMSKKKCKKFKPEKRLNFNVGSNWHIFWYSIFLAYMVQKYKNKISPIFYYGKSPKTNEKDLKIPILQPIDWGQPYWMTRYIWGWHYLLPSLQMEWREGQLPTFCPDPDFLFILQQVIGANKTDQDNRKSNIIYLV